MGMSWAYGPSDRDDCLAVLDRSIELGCNHWDTADLYGAGENEKLLSERVSKYRDQLFLATKFGNVVDRSMTSHQDQVAANAPWIVDGTPEYIRKSIDKSLSLLKTDYVDLYYQHRVDPLVPIEETVGAIAELVEKGKIRGIGLSEASAETIRRAAKVHTIAAVQSELSLWTRDLLDDVVPTCGELGITFVAYSPLGRGFLTGTIPKASEMADNDNRRTHPRFSDEAHAENMQLVTQVGAIAHSLGATKAQVALAWVLAQGEHVIPIAGTRKVSRLEENVAADSVQLSADSIRELDGIAAAIGARYPEGTMKFVNG